MLTAACTSARAFATSLLAVAIITAVVIRIVLKLRYMHITLQKMLVFHGNLQYFVIFEDRSFREHQRFL